MSKLKPCPFCGGEAYRSYNEKESLFCCNCFKCGAMIGYESETDAINFWNQRDNPVFVEKTNMNEAKKSVFVGQEATILNGKCSGITGMVIGADSNENTVEIDVEGATIFTAYDNITQATAREIKFRGKRGE